ncbi:MAG: aldo/keto reductase [Pseudomonadota bacterium]
MNNNGGKFRWGIIGPGGIARSFAGGVENSKFGRLEAIASRTPGKPNLPKAFPGVRIVDGYQGLIDDPDIDIIYISTPHPSHAQWAIKCAEAGKHVLCEKPIGLTSFEADAIFNAARKAGTFMGEAYMYRLHPQTAKILEVLASGLIGDVRLIKAAFGFYMGGNSPGHRLFANDLAGGGILDVGGYPVSISRLIAGALKAKPFDDPITVSGTAHLGETGVDEWAAATLTFDGGLIAEVSCAVDLELDNCVRVFGTKGRLEVDEFWLGSGEKGGTGKINITLTDGTGQTIDCEEFGWLYSFEADAVAEAVRAGRQEFSPPGMTWDDTLGNLRVMDKWRADCGLVYDIETSTRRTTTLVGGPLKVGPNPIERRTVPGLSQPTSPVALGFEFFEDFSSASILLDAYFERGGNLFDTAHIYGNGLTERIFGQWQRSRNVRNDCLIIGKGAHSPLCYPDQVGKQLAASLEGLQTDYVDVYFMHRDNPDIPVGEFVDAMDAEISAGRIRGPFGGSNWTRERFDAAVAYAEANGKAKPTALSNNFSLAEMIDPIWPGCITASGDDWKAWHTQHQFPNFAWSSQGRGFFTDSAGRDKFDHPEIVRCWYSDKNFDRRDRAIQLAEQLGRSPIHIALAYVLTQPFPSIALIGPRRLLELEDSLSALDIKLTPDQVRWLEASK